MGMIYNVVSLVGSFPLFFSLELGPCTKGCVLETNSIKYTFVSNCCTLEYI